jgi:hypothetical protein
MPNVLIARALLLVPFLVVAADGVVMGDGAAIGDQRGGM